MRRIAVAWIGACTFLFLKSASAHRIDEYLQATIVSLETDRVQASMRLIPGILVAPSVIAGIDSNRDGVFSVDENRAYAQRVLDELSITLDGRNVQPVLLSYSFPVPAEMRQGLGEIHIEYEIEHTASGSRGGLIQCLIIKNHHLNRTSVYLMNVLAPEDRDIQILAQKRNNQQSVYELAFQVAPPPHMGWRSTPTWLSVTQFSSLFQLGMRHIAEGTDHLLFLLVLLLPAPLVVSHSRWGLPSAMRPSLIRILGIVTAFTIGHSVTLTLAALNFVNVPSRPVEVLIAVSILASALHACRPIFSGKEAWIAGFFGLVHGLAFASTLGRLGLGGWDRIAGILAFNLGIETMQMFVVAAVLPSLLLMSRTRAYLFLRISGGVFAGCASIGWVVERLSDVVTPVDTIVNAFAQHALLIAVGLLAVSLACRFLLASPAKSSALVGASISASSGVQSV